METTLEERRYLKPTETQEELPDFFTTLRLPIRKRTPG
jgi:hypothetical protein